GEAAVLMNGVTLARELATPQALAVLSTQAQKDTLAGFRQGAGDEEAFAPEDRRRVPHARERNLPVEILFGPAGRERRCADPGTASTPGSGSAHRRPAAGSLSATHDRDA